VANHIRGALANGATKDEIAEVILQMAFYAGWPRAGNAIRIARKVFAE
jgi:4-carboxymuconolactone decarboxylase